MRMAGTLFLDFEGEGPKGPDRVPKLPFLAGLYQPKNRGRKSQFSVSLFREHCTPIKNGIPEISEITTLEAFIERITKRAETEDLTIYYWSEYELDVLKEFLKSNRSLIKRFTKISLNAKLDAKTYLNRLGREVPEHEKKKLNAFLSAVCPKATPVSAPRLGAAESCRRLERYSLKEKKWSRWTDKQKSVAKELVRYNREDCVATAKIMRKILSSPARLKRDAKYASKTTSRGENE